MIGWLLLHPAGLYQKNSCVEKMAPVDPYIYMYKYMDQQTSKGREKMKTGRDKEMNR
jgi:hypothetical protein